MSDNDNRSTDQTIPFSPHSLNPDTKAELLSLLGLDSEDPIEEERAKHAIQRVERLLGIYEPAKAALRDLPSPGEFVSTMNKISRRASRLQESLSDMHDRIRGALDVGGFDLETLELGLSKLQKTADLVKSSSKPAQGRPTKEVFDVIVGQLRMIFRHYYCGQTTHRKTEGAINHLSHQEQDEADFIKFALDDAKIRRPKKIRRVYDNIGTPLSNRDKAIKKIEAEAKRRSDSGSSPEDGTKK